MRFYGSLHDGGLRRHDVWTILVILAMVAMVAYIVWAIKQRSDRLDELRASCVFERIERVPSTCWRSVTRTDWNGHVHSDSEPYPCERVVECYLCDGGEECL